jgi:hypothetical protein
MFVFVSVSESRGLLWHLVHDHIYIKINKWQHFSLYHLCIELGNVGSHYTLFTKPSDGEHKEQPVQWPAQQQQILLILHSDPSGFPKLTRRPRFLQLGPKLKKTFTKRSLASEKSTK